MTIPAQTSIPSYEEDFHAWALGNAALLRAHRFTEIDSENIAEELEGMARSERRELVNRLKVLLAHLLKWRYQPEKRCESWEGTIIEQRDQIGDLLSDSPSLKPMLPESFAKAYPRAVHESMQETKLAKTELPAECPFTIEQVLDSEFLPD